MADILVIDDDEDVSQALETNLTQNGHRVACALDGYQALKLIDRYVPNLILLDIAMPGMNGIEVCERIREKPSTRNVPVLFLTAQGSIESKIQGFNVGGDDYLVKPFDLQELNLRVNALLRRTKPASTTAPELIVGGMKLNSRTFEFNVSGRLVLLTPVEFELLYYMMSNAGQVFSSEQLLQHVWKYPPGTGSPELVRAHIRNIRNKIEVNPKEPMILQTVGRFGYTVQNPREV
jgi:two-component system, OmpR family, response regulator RpaA